MTPTTARATRTRPPTTAELQQLERTLTEALALLDDPVALLRRADFLIARQRVALKRSEASLVGGQDSSKSGENGGHGASGAKTRRRWTPAHRHA